MGVPRLETERLQMRGFYAPVTTEVFMEQAIAEHMPNRQSWDVPIGAPRTFDQQCGALARAMREPFNGPWVDDKITSLREFIKSSTADGTSAEELFRTWDSQLHVSHAYNTIMSWYQSDVEMLHTTTGDPETMQHYVDLYPGANAWTFEQTARNIQTWNRSWGEKGYGQWAIFTKEKFPPLFEGYMGYMNGYGGLGEVDYLDGLEGEIELSVFLHHALFGQGLGPEAAAAFMGWGFENLDVDSIVMAELDQAPGAPAREPAMAVAVPGKTVDIHRAKRQPLDSILGCATEENARSIATLGKLGMVYEQTLPYHSEISGKDANFRVHRLTRQDWQRNGGAASNRLGLTR